MLTRRKTIMMCLLFVAVVVIGVYFNFSSNKDSSPSPVTAIEQERGVGYVSYMIRELPTSSGEIAFFMRNKVKDQIQISAEYVKKTPKGWMWEGGGSFGDSNIRMGLSDQEVKKKGFHVKYLPGKGSSLYGSSPFPMIYGIALNPNISRITVKDYKTDLEKQAEFVTIEPNFRLFYVFVDKSQGTEFDITGYTKNGNILQRTKIDELLQTQASVIEFEE